MVDTEATHNAINYNDLLVRLQSDMYSKPRFCAWPLGGYTRKEVQHRSSTGLMEVSPGASEFNRRFTKNGNIRYGTVTWGSNKHVGESSSSSLNLCSSVVWKCRSQEDAPLDKQKLYKRDLNDRLERWTRKEYDISPSNVLPEPVSSQPSKAVVAISSSRDEVLFEQLVPETAPIDKHFCGILFSSVAKRIRPTPYHKLRPEANPAVVARMREDWRKRRMLRVANVPNKGYKEQDVNPVLYFDLPSD